MGRIEILDTRSFQNSWDIVDEQVLKGNQQVVVHFNDMWMFKLVRIFAQMFCFNDLLQQCCKFVVILQQ